jgi:c-di-GMP-binding flagellar brake protein YcgR
MQNDIRKGPPRLADAVELIAADSKPQELSDPNEIGGALALLAQNGDPVSIYPDGGPQVVMARILSVDPELPHFVIQLNEGSMLPSGACTFVARLSHARIQFRLSDPHRHALPGQATLVQAGFPESCQVLNRRASERLEAPLGANCIAALIVSGKPYELQLYDISLAGVGMLCAPRDAATLHVGRKLERVRLELGQAGEIVCDLEIRLSRRFRTFLLGEQVQIGCRFTRPTQQTLDALRGALDRMNSKRRQR